MVELTHVAIIMDGNGRWAMTRGQERSEGHKIGVDTTKDIIFAARELGIKYLTLYVFSTENWCRDEQEINSIITLLEKVLEQSIEALRENGVALRVIGNLSLCSKNLRNRIKEIEKEGKLENPDMTLILAFSYGSRSEIVSAIRSMVRDNVSSAEVTEEIFARYLYTAGIPDPDLLIRTGGELRLSNFLLWQLAYSELYFTNKLWPDFSKEDLLLAIEHYNTRERRYGKNSKR